VAQGRPGALQDRAAIEALVRQWVRFDWLRVAVATAGFVASIRAISIPFPGSSGDVSRTP
jgi:hypothetical protein